MKSRIISLILILATVFSVSTGFAVINEEFFNFSTDIAIISDLHVKADSFFSDQQSFDKFREEDKMIHLSEAIAKSMVDDIIARKNIKTVFVTGDLTEDGDLISHRAVANIFKKLTDNGKQVFVINGNHDGAKKSEYLDYKAGADDFREIYKNFGYGKAIEKHNESLSYVADIDKKFRVIAIDNDEYFSTDLNKVKQQMDDNLTNWIKQKVLQCRKDGKTPIVILHKPLVNHMDFVGEIVGKAQIDDSFGELAEMLGNNGCHYVFSGHQHGQDIAYHKSKKGNMLFDIETSSSVYVPSSYRLVQFTDTKVIINSRKLEKLNMNYVSSYISTAEYYEINNNFQAYAYSHFSDSIHNLISSILFNPSDLRNIFGLNEEYTPLFQLIIDEIFNPLLTMPLYDNQAGLSLEKIITDNGGQSLPETEYENLLELAAFFVASLNRGDENVPFESAELFILKKSVSAVFYLINNIRNDLSLYFPDSPMINIDTELLFSEGKLELINSNLLEFVFLLVRDSLPGFLQNLNFSNLNFFQGSIFEGILNGLIEGLGTETIKTVGETEIMIDNLIDDVLYQFVMKDILKDKYPADNNLTIQRDTVESV